MGPCLLIRSIPARRTIIARLLGEVLPMDRMRRAGQFRGQPAADWNGKAVQYGGGGSNGVLITGLAPLRDARRDTPVPVARGFATWAPIQATTTKKLPHPRAFALNDESLVNYGYAAYKKTAMNVGCASHERFTIGAPAKTYFYGGRKAARSLMMAQRFPTDFDGVVSVVARVQLHGWQSGGGKACPASTGRRLDQPGQSQLIHNAVNAACDKLDASRTVSSVPMKNA